MYARHVEHVSTRAARRRSAQYELSADESSSPQTAHLARENRHAVAQRPHTSERGEPAMNSPLSSAITDTCAGAAADGAGRTAPVLGDCGRPRRPLEDGSGRGMEPEPESGLDERQVVEPRLHARGELRRGHPRQRVRRFAERRGGGRANGGDRQRQLGHDLLRRPRRVEQRPVATWSQSRGARLVEPRRLVPEHDAHQP